MGLLIGKFSQFLTELSAHDMIMAMTAGYYRFMLYVICFSVGDFRLIGLKHLTKDGGYLVWAISHTVLHALL